MSSREYIIAKIKENKPDFIELLEIDTKIFDENLNLIKEFEKKVEVAGGKVFTATSNEDVIHQITEMFSGTKVNFSTLLGTDNFNSISLEKTKSPRELEDLDVLILESNLGVAENGAVWLSDTQIPIRVLPFITKHLVLVLDKNMIVSHLHRAYSILTSEEINYGVFISGPSKTADIEQSLVIGAHGALSLTVFLVGITNYKL